MAKHYRLDDLEGGMWMLTAEAARLASELTPTPTCYFAYPLVVVGTPAIDEVCYGVYTVRYQFKWLIPPKANSDIADAKHETLSGGLVGRQVEFTVIDAFPFGVRQWQIVALKVLNNAVDYGSSSVMDESCGYWRELDTDVLQRRDIDPAATMIGVRTVEIKGAVELVEHASDRTGPESREIRMVTPFRKNESDHAAAKSDAPSVLARREFADLRGYIRAQIAIAKARPAYDKMRQGRLGFYAALLA